MAEKKRALKPITRKQLQKRFGKDYRPPTLQELQALPRTSFNSVLAALDLPEQNLPRKSLLKSVKLQVEKLKKQLLTLEKQLSRL